ncbi:radical SAM protein [Pleurocapsa sp. FMAR1]|uniref:radical SAM protein n=1 Tax=Pleurocapsa sp. FMAR1 TaxID=3040204 RepID=UPI0029C93E43|nr:radical SAM protein [Pleurocapsa sp. FMAR1]
MRVKQPLRSAIDLLFLKSPLEAQLIVTRRCNLSCGYCTEFDNYSSPVPLELLKERIDAIHRLRVVNTSLLGGEPLMHPDIVEIIKYSNRKNQVSITTNGFLLTEKLVKKLNEAGLSNLQISIDALDTDSTGYIQKSLKKLLPKLEILREHANFDVHANIVLCESTKLTFMETLSKIRAFGFNVSVGLMHDEKGQIEIEGEEYLKLWDEYFTTSGELYPLSDYDYGRKLLQGQKPKWKCRSGSRYLYVDEFGLVQYCSSQRDRLNKPLIEYSLGDLKQQSQQSKGCEEGCSIMCVYRDSMLDNEPKEILKGIYKVLSQKFLVPSKS